MTPSLKTSPATKPVSLAEFKSHARIDFDDDDAIAQMYLDAATHYLDGYDGVLGLCIINQVWTAQANGWGDEITLPFPRVSMVSVTYVDTDEQTQTVAPADYQIFEDHGPTVLRWKSSFSFPELAEGFGNISVEFTSGYGDASADVPPPIRQAIMLLAAHWYENREASLAGVTASELPMAVEYLISPYRRGMV